MSEYLIQDTTLTDIANVIRNKTGDTAMIAVPDMAALIGGIQTKQIYITDGIISVNTLDTNFYQIISTYTLQANFQADMLWMFHDYSIILTDNINKAPHFDIAIVDYVNRICLNSQEYYKGGYAGYHTYCYNDFGSNHGEYYIGSFSDSPYANQQNNTTITLLGKRLAMPNFGGITNCVSKLCAIKF